MLQQTQVTTVLPYYERFSGPFPDVLSLAAAKRGRCSRCGQGLGYYSRARNLHRAAQQVVTQHGGRFPADVDALAALPGVGRSTAGHRSLAYDVSRAILDGNVKRVLPGMRRWMASGAAAVERSSGRSPVSGCPQSADIVAYTQGLMDLGATVCTRADPRCGTAPRWRTDCAARGDAPPSCRPRARRKRCRNGGSATCCFVTVTRCCWSNARRPASGVGFGACRKSAMMKSALPALLARNFGVNRHRRYRQPPDIVHTFTPSA